MLVARTRQALHDLQARYIDQVEVVAGDLLDSTVVRQAIEAAIQRWDRIDGLILNHATMSVEKVDESNTLEWARIMNVNFFSGVEMVSVFFFNKNRHYHIIIIPLYQVYIKCVCVCVDIFPRERKGDEMADQFFIKKFPPPPSKHRFVRLYRISVLRMVGSSSSHPGRPSAPTPVGAPTGRPKRP